MKGGLWRVAGSIALLTLLSKAFGFGRELVVAAGFGAGVAKDAYTAAYILPAFALVMLGGLTGPFHTGAQKILVTMRQQGEDARVPGVMTAVLCSVGLGMGLLALAVGVGAPWAIHMVASQATPAVHDLAVAQLRLMSPLVLLGAWIGVFCGISNDQQDFKTPSFGPLLASLAVIGVVLVRPEPMALAWGTLLGGVLQFFLQLPSVVRLYAGSGAAAWKPDFAHPEVRRLWPLLVPAAVASTVGTLNVIIGTNFASSLPPGAMSVYDYANKLLQLPLGVLMTALLIPLFPRLAEAVAGGRKDRLLHFLNRGIETVSLATWPLAALFVTLGEPMVRVLYERGAFDAEATRQTALVLAIASMGLFAYALRDLMVRVFYALDDSRTPLLVSLGSLAATTALLAALVGPFGLAGLTAGTAFVTLGNAVAVAALLRRKLGAMPVSSGALTAAKALGASLAAGACAWALAQALPWPAGTGGALLQLVALGPLEIGVYLALLVWWRAPIVELLPARFRPAPPADGGALGRRPTGSDGYNGH